MLFLLCKLGSMDNEFNNLTLEKYRVDVYSSGNAIVLLRWYISRCKIVYG